MNLFITSIAHNLRSLWRFSGLDTRGLFWPYAITVVIIVYAAMMAAIMPEMQRTAMNAMKDGKMVMPDFSSLMRWMLVFTAIFVVLLAASIARRLKDRGKSPVWALPPFILTIASLVVSPNPIAILEMPRWAFFALYVVILGGQISLIYLIVLLAGRSRPADGT